MSHAGNKRRMMVQSIAVLAAITFACAAAPAAAEKADRDKPVNIESDRMNADDSKKTATFEGKVVLTQGTMVIRADRVVVRQDSDGFQFGIATGALASFRQKRDGASDYIDAEAERIEYDSKADRVEFFSRARLRRGGGDDVCGNFISYDSRTEFFTVNAGKGAAADSRAAQNGRRVHATLMPRNGNNPAEAKPLSKPGEPCPN